MKAVFFDPYLDTIGGGERYTLTLVESLLKKGWLVDLIGGSKELKEKSESRFNLNLEGINFLPKIDNLFQRWLNGRNYDLFFWLSDGSIPFLFAKKNLLHFQVPFHGVGGRSFLNKIKLDRIDNVVCNSGFTKRFIDAEYGVNSKVIFPPVDIENFKPSKKENIILGVGRFSQLLQVKRQDVLIEAFKSLVNGGFKGWRLFLAGGTDVGGKDFLADLKKASTGYPVEFYDNCTFDILKNLYSRAKIFWHAAGYGVDEKSEPEKTEHFGITVVEAMSAGCIPFIVNKGGLKEIVEEGITGYFWEEPEELTQKFLSLVGKEEEINEIMPKVIKSIQRFNKKRFCEEFSKIIG